MWITFLSLVSGLLQKKSMRITEIRAVRLDLTDALRSYVREKVMSLEKFTKRYFPVTVEAELDKTTDRHQKGAVWRAALQLTIPGATLHAEAVMDDMYAAIDKAKDDLKRQLTEYSKKRLDMVQA